MRFTRSSLALAGLLALGLTGSAQAAIPNNQTGVYSACMANVERRAPADRLPGLRQQLQVHRDRSRAGTRPARRAPPGPQGPAGAEGRHRAAGRAPASRSPAGTSAPASTTIGTDYSTLATVDLPAGMYMLSGQGERVHVRDAVPRGAASMHDLPPAAEGQLRGRDRARHRVHRDQRRLPATAIQPVRSWVSPTSRAGQTDKLHLQCKDDGLVTAYFNSRRRHQADRDAGRRLHGSVQLDRHGESGPRRRWPVATAARSRSPARARPSGRAGTCSAR